MTPDLPTRVRVAFDGELAKCAGSYDACCEEHQDAALAAVIAVVQEDRTAEIATWVWTSAPVDKSWLREEISDAIIREFGGTTHDE